MFIDTGHIVFCKRLCNGQVSVRPSVHLSVPSIDNCSDLLLVSDLLFTSYWFMSAACCSLGAGSRYQSTAASARAWAAASINAVIRGGSTQTLVTALYYANTASWSDWADVYSLWQLRRSLTMAQLIHKTCWISLTYTALLSLSTLMAVINKTRWVTVVSSCT